MAIETQDFIIKIPIREDMDDAQFDSMMQRGERELESNMGVPIDEAFDIIRGSINK